MKQLYRHCERCGGVTHMGEYCSDLRGEDKLNAIRHLESKHKKGDDFLYD